jgi:hypothetical protein
MTIEVRGVRIRQSAADDWHVTYTLDGRDLIHRVRADSAQSSAEAESITKRDLGLSED